MESTYNPGLRGACNRAAGQARRDRCLVLYRDLASNEGLLDGLASAGLKQGEEDLLNSEHLAWHIA